MEIFDPVAHLTYCQTSHLLHLPICLFIFVFLQQNKIFEPKTIQRFTQLLSCVIKLCPFNEQMLLVKEPCEKGVRAEQAPHMMQRHKLVTLSPFPAMELLCWSHTLYLDDALKLNFLWSLYRICSKS